MLQSLTRQPAVLTETAALVDKKKAVQLVTETLQGM